jgi:hypothetical protein
LRSARSLISQHRRSASTFLACGEYPSCARAFADLFHLIDLVHGVDRNEGERAGALQSLV